MQTMSLQYYEAYIYVKDRRYSINPNRGFKRQLSEWSESIRKITAAATSMSPQSSAGDVTLSPPVVSVTTASGRNLFSKEARANEVVGRKPREGLALTPAIQKLKEGTL